VLGGYLILLITAGSDFYKYSSIKRIVPSRYLKINQNERVIGSSYFKNLKELMVVMKELMIFRK
jgi:hypothetical protein